MTRALPDYAARLDALHRALEDDFRGIVGKLPIAGGETIVDAGCGDGFFTGLIAERLANGQVIGLDVSPAYLAAAAERLREPIAQGRVLLQQGDVNELPYEPATLDGIWSGHSMQSYEPIPHVLGEFRRVLRPGGWLAVLETDNIHSIMLSWPPHLELAIRQAEDREIGDEDSYRGVYFPRFAPRLLRAAGFNDVQREYVFIHRQPPAGAALETYIRLYVEHVLEQTGDRLSSAHRALAQELADGDSPRFLPRQENFFFGSLQVLITAR